MTEEGENFRKGERGGGQVGLGWAEMETEDTPSWLPAYWVRSGDGTGGLFNWRWGLAGACIYS